MTRTLNHAGLLALGVLVVAFAGCVQKPPAATDMTAIPTGGILAPAPADQFHAALKSLCGKAFAGRVAVDTPAAPGPDAFADKSLVMHVRGCGDDELRLPFHVDDDRSRTWVITRIDGGTADARLRLKHDHRHEDGSDDTSTMYGGVSVAAGTAERQEFPVDRYSVDLFAGAGNTASQANTWAMELRPGREFMYELARPGGRLFRVEFDLTRPIAPPPAPWGDED